MASSIFEEVLFGIDGTMEQNVLQIETFQTLKMFNENLPTYQTLTFNDDLVIITSKTNEML